MSIGQETPHQVNQGTLNRLEEIAAWSPDQARQFLATKPPLQCASDIPSPIADAIPDDMCGPTFCVGITYTTEQQKKWAGITHAKVVGDAAIRYLVCEKLLPIANSGKDVVVVNCDEAFRTCLFGVGVKSFYSWDFDLNDQDQVLKLRDEIATCPVGALVLLNQEGKLQHLNMIENVPVYRNGRVVMVKKVPIFHVNNELFTCEWGINPTTGEKEERLQFTPAQFCRFGENANVKQTINIEWADTIKREITQWLIPEFLPLCEVTAFSGEMDTRKSTTVIDIAAKGSTGGGVDKCWFNNTPFDGLPFSTIYAGTEDSFSTVQNRFIAAGGNSKALGKLSIEVRKERPTPDGVEVVSIPLSFDEHLSFLRDAIIKANKTALYPIGLLINDPLIAFFGNKNFNKAQDCQDILVGLKKLCEELKISIINLMHYNKTQGASAKEKTGGSQRLIEAHRQAWSFTLIDEADKESNTLIAPIKKNLLRVAQSYEITTVSTPVEWEDDGVKKHDEVGVVKFVRLSDQTADGQLQEKAAKDKGKQTEMRDAVLEALKNGAVAPGVVYDALHDLGSESTILRAVNRLIKSGKVRKDGTGPSNTRWMLAEASEQASFDAELKVEQNKQGDEL